MVRGEAAGQLAASPQLKEILMKKQDIVYKTPGPHQRPGGTFDYKGTSNAEEHEEALKSGWFPSLAEAVAGKLDEKKVEAPVDTGELETLGDAAPPTRPELEQKAKELGISFNKKTTDEQLVKLIEKALGG